MTSLIGTRFGEWEVTKVEQFAEYVYVEVTRFFDGGNVRFDDAVRRKRLLDVPIERREAAYREAIWSWDGPDAAIFAVALAYHYAATGVLERMVRETRQERIAEHTGSVTALPTGDKFEPGDMVAVGPDGRAVKVSDQPIGVLESGEPNADGTVTVVGGGYRFQMLGPVPTKHNDISMSGSVAGGKSVADQLAEYELANPDKFRFAPMEMLRPAGDEHPSGLATSEPTKYNIKFETPPFRDGWVEEALKKYEIQIRDQVFSFCGPETARWGTTAPAEQFTASAEKPAPTKCKYNARAKGDGPQAYVIVDSPHWAEGDKRADHRGYCAARDREMVRALEASRRSILRTMRELPWCVECNRQVALVVHRGMLFWHCEGCHGVVDGQT